MPFKFENLEVWKLAVAYIDTIYVIADQLPRGEEYNLRSQIVRAATSVALNIAEGSTGQTDDEQARFLGVAIRSLVETVACQHLIHRRRLLTDPAPLRTAYTQAEMLVARLHTLRRTLAPAQKWLREPESEYQPGAPTPFDMPGDTT
jgi:four helix bundle protein